MSKEFANEWSHILSGWWWWQLWSDMCAATQDECRARTSTVKGLVLEILARLTLASKLIELKMFHVHINFKGKIWSKNIRAEFLLKNRIFDQGDERKLAVNLKVDRSVYHSVPSSLVVHESFHRPLQTFHYTNYCSSKMNSYFWSNILSIIKLLLSLLSF